MAGAGWTPTVDGFLGRLTKARILAAVREAKGDRAGDRIEHMKKGDMAEAAAQILAGSGWLPEPLRTPGRAIGTVAAETADAGDAAITAPAPVETADTDVVEETAEDGGETAMGEFDPVDDDEEAEANVPHAVAAE